MNANNLMPPDVTARVRPVAGSGLRGPRRLVLAACFFLALMDCLMGWAYPPSPYHLIYGTVRDEYGTPLSNAQAQVLLVRSGGVQNETSIQPGLAIGVNYQLRVPMDTLLKPGPYRSNAVPAGAGFTMFVVIGNITNVPLISTSTSTNLGGPAKMTRIDLQLGQDTNGDGIPDAWELAFLTALGSDLELADLHAGLFLAHAGRTLMQEYLLGTSALDLIGPLAVRIAALNGGAPLLEFPIASGRSYTVLGSSDLQQWATLSFRLPAEGASALTRTNYTSPSAQTLQVQVVPSSSGTGPQFFRIGVQ